MADEFDQHASEYADKINKSVNFSGRDHSFFTALKADVLAHQLKPAAGENLPRLLDVGCGVGSLHPWLRDHVSDIVGVDVSAASLAIARRENPTSQFVRYDGHSLPFKDGAFDAVVATCVVHHVPVDQWPAFFAELRRVLRVGGKALIVEHNPLNPVTRYVVNSCELDKYAVLIRAAHCRSLLAETGFGEVGADYFALLPFLAPAARAVERWLGAIPLGAQYVAYGRRAA